MSILPSKTGFLFLYANRVRTAYSIAFLLLLISLAASLGTVQKLIATSSNVTNANNVIFNLEGLISHIKDAETGMRGYLIMKDGRFLDPFYGSRQKADSVMQVIRSLTTDDTVIILKFNRLDAIIKRRYQILSDELEMNNRNKFSLSDSMRRSLYTGKLTMDSIRVSVKEMQLHEMGYLGLAERKVIDTRAYIQIIIIGSLIVSILLAFYSFFTFNKESKARQQADEKAIAYRKRLESRVVELRNANLELVKLRRNEKFAATGRIARTIAHEVRNPLTNINLAAEQLKEDGGRNRDDDNMLLEMISRNGNRINQLVTDLLDSTRFSELNYEAKSINSLVDDAMELAADRIGLHHITVVKNYAADICDVEVDAEQIKIAFLNIIVNAIEAMEPGNGVLTLRTAGEKYQCVVCISDNGIGMDEEAQQNLFEPYFTNKPNGNGLGMTNTQKIILNHNGSISVESAPGAGTTFIISLRFPE